MNENSWDMGEIEPNHLNEWTIGSGISHEITRLNLLSLTGDEALQAITEQRLGQLNGDGQQYATKPVADVLAHYAHLQAGGWWCNSSGASGCLKPNTPRKDVDGKLIKYENPLGVQAGVFQLRMPSDRYWLELEERTSQLVVITEGCKKAAALLSCEIAALGLAGIWNGTPKNEMEQFDIHPYLKQWAHHRIVICFDWSEKPNGRNAVKKASLRLAQQLYRYGSPWVGIAHCKGPEKGIDDVLVAHGPAAVHRQIAAATKVDLEFEQAERQRAQNIELAANAYLDAASESERTAIRSRICSNYRVSAADFSRVCDEQIQKRHPLRKLPSRSLTPDEMDSQPLDEVRTFYEQLLIERCSTLIGGNKGSTKTILTLHLLVGLIKKQSPDIIGLRPEARGLKVLYVCSDAPAERIKGYLIQMGYWEEPEVRKSFRLWGNSVTTRKWTITDLDSLDQEMESYQPNVVVIDSVKGALGHLLEDISRPVIRSYMDAVHDVVLRSAALIWIHHANKQGQIADNEGLTESPDIVYLLKKESDEKVSLKAVKNRSGMGIKREYRLDSDFLLPVLVEAMKPRSDLSKVKSVVMEYVRKQNSYGITPSIKTVQDGLPEHEPEAVASAIRRLREVQMLTATRDPKDGRSALLSIGDTLSP